MSTSPLSDASNHTQPNWRACSWTVQRFLDILKPHLKAPSAAPDALREKRLLRVCTHTDYVTAGVVFVPFVGEKTDGNNFVPQALGQGALLALTERDPQTFSPALTAAEKARCVYIDHADKALATLAKAARHDSVGTTFIGITGSAGKTSTKDGLHFVLKYLGATTHKARSSFNNHIGVPLTLLNKPAEATHAVIEMGMNAPGEISFLSCIARPHVGLITTIGAAHQWTFKDVHGIAMEKASIAEGLEPEGTMVLNADAPHLQAVLSKVRSKAARVFTFGQAEEATFHLSTFDLGVDRSAFTVRFAGTDYSSFIPRTGLHEIMNALGILAVCHALHFNVPDVLKALQHLPPVCEGRGGALSVPAHNGLGPWTLLDGSYNANPLSMRAALQALSLWEPKGQGRRVAILGDMGELGDIEAAAHKELAALLEKNQIQAVITIGPLMKKHLAPALPAALLRGTFDTSQEAARFVPQLLNAGDVVAIKGSFSMGLKTIVEALVKEAEDGKN